MLLSFLLLSVISLTFNAHYPYLPPHTPYHKPTTPADSLFMADPTIFHHKGIYYLYGTGGNSGKGFLVYTSSDMKSWKGPAGTSDGYALIKGDSYGTTGFWAPQVFYYKGTFYMAYTANENIAIAESNSPLGPFKQKAVRAISGPGKQIDPFVFIDTDGKKYLYHVRLGGGNKLFVAELNGDLSDIIQGTGIKCLEGTEPWENTTHSKTPITEGPTVLKHRGLYYLIYSANDFRNINYAVGYATSTTPTGPWEKYSSNPILDRQLTGRNGPGHGDFVQGKKGKLMYVFHTHRSDQVVSPRVTAMVKANFIRKGKAAADVMKIDDKSLYYPWLIK